MKPTYSFRGPIVRGTLPVWGLALLLILATGCMGSGAMSRDGQGPWTERLELEVGERGTFADGSLVITPTEIGDAHALVTIEGSDTPSGGRLTTDPGGFVTVPPYRIYLLSADAGRRAVIAVAPAG